MLEVFESRKGHKIEIKSDKEEIFVEIESVAKGLGLTREKNGKQYVRWDRVNSYLKEITQSWGNGKEITQSWGKGDLITESQFYLLAMKANNDIARIFQTWVCVEVLPTIRKKGCYISDNITEKQIKEAKKYLDITQIKKIMKTCLPADLEHNYKLAKVGLGRRGKEQLDNEVIKILRNRAVSIEGQDLLYKIIDKRNKALDRKVKKIDKLVVDLEENIKSILPTETEYTEVKTYGFSVNAMYIARGEYGEVKMRRSAKYNNWCNDFPFEQLPNVEGIDFTKRVDIWLEFDHLKKFDCHNLHKSLIDTACKHWGVNDNNIQLMRCVTRKYVKDVNDARIYICIKQGEE